MPTMRAEAAEAAAREVARVLKRMIMVYELSLVGGEGGVAFVGFV